jgi:hypothetical protein
VEDLSLNTNKKAPFERSFKEIYINTLMGRRKFNGRKI